MKNQIETIGLTHYEKFRYIQEHKFDIDKCIVEAWDLKPKENVMASWQSVEYPEIKGTTIPLTNENINDKFGRRFYAGLSKEDNLFEVKI